MLQEYKDKKNKSWLERTGKNVFKEMVFKPITERCAGGAVREKQQNISGGKTRVRGMFRG